MHAMHTRLLEQLESVINPPVLDVWVKEIEAWENDNREPNPFAPRVKRKRSYLPKEDIDSFYPVAPTQNDVRLALASCDMQVIEANQVAIRCAVTGSMMIHMGLELEELQ
jgi:hypothetical protein